MTFNWCNNQDDLQRWQRTLDPDALLYVDTEFMRERTFWSKLALVQINDGNGITLFDPLSIPGECFAELFHTHTIVMHACSEDLEALHTFTGSLPRRVIDTQVAAALCGEDMQLGYQRIVANMLHVDLPKGATRTNWLTRPLSETQLAYARDDVAYLPDIYDQLNARLNDLGRQPWLEEECQRLLDTANRPYRPENAWRQVKGAGVLDGQQLAILQGLAAWREDRARQRDLPKSFVIRDEILIALCLAVPQTLDGLAAEGVHPKVVSREGNLILGLLADGQHAEPLPPLPGPPDAEQKKQLKALRAEVQRIALELQLKPDVLMRRRWLEAIVRHPERLPGALMGWRFDLVTRPLLNAMGIDGNTYVER